MNKSSWINELASDIIFNRHFVELHNENDMAVILQDLIIEHAPKEVEKGPDDHRLDNVNEVFFYENDFYPLSNFSSFTLMWRGLRFATSEAAYHWEKFQGYNYAVSARILEATSAHDTYKIAEEYKHLRRPDWDEVKVDLMRGILKAKVAQHPYVKAKLLATGIRKLTEDSWRDSFWGSGPDGKGANMLGNLWMNIRAELSYQEKLKNEHTVDQ